MPSLAYGVFCAVASLRLVLGVPQAAVSSTTPTAAQPGVVEDCEGFYAAKSGQPCSEIAKVNNITMQDLLEFNPHLDSSCDGLPQDLNLCVSVAEGCEPETPSPTSAPTSAPGGTTTPTPISTSAPSGTTSTPTSNGPTTSPLAPSGSTAPSGITTPTPDQPDIVDNCNAFYYVKPNDDCSTIAQAYGITVDQFLKWNPDAGSQCQNLWASAYACVGVVGETAAPTQPPNGVATPTPIQPGLVSNCKTFVFVKSGQTCADIVAQYHVSLADFIKWNPNVGSNCEGLWGNTYACIAVLDS